VKIYYTSMCAQACVAFKRVYQASMEGVEIRESLKKMKLYMPNHRKWWNVESKKSLC